MLSSVKKTTLFLNPFCKTTIRAMHRLHTRDTATSTNQHDTFPGLSGNHDCEPAHAGVVPLPLPSSQRTDSRPRQGNNHSVGSCFP